MLSVNCNSGNSSETAVRLSFDSVFRKSEDELSTFAISDIQVVIGKEQRPPSPAHIRIPRNLNEGVAGSSVQPIYLWYKVAPLGGFVCDTNATGHSEFGECLFLSRHAGRDVSSVSSFGSDRIKAALAMAEFRKKADEVMLRSVYQHGERSMTSRLQSTLERVRTYESKTMQEEALKYIPAQLLHERARGNASPMPAYQDELVMQLLHWFKREFFSWMNQPKCSACGCASTKLIHMEGPSTPEEVSGEAGRVEVYQCPQCSSLTRFPRYNNPVKLLETRTGRCGEWANCFMLCCRAMGFEARYVLDVTDHVWTEVYSEHFKRWLHCDSCEDQLDCPLTYEVGWGKKLSYIFSISHEEIVDSAKRYTQNWDEMRARREEVSEKWLKTTIAQMNQRIQSALPRPRVKLLEARAKDEQEELERGRAVTTAEVQGRVSGSAEWKSQRNEDGQQQQQTSLDGKPSSSSSSAGGPSQFAPTLIVELSQQLCRNLLLGCANESCPNPFCLHGFEDRAQDMTAHAANSIQLVGSFNQKGFTAASLASLLCPQSPSELRWFVLAQRPLLYLPLQDSESPNGTSWLVDSSGNENHVVNKSSCPVRKPFQIPQPGDATASYGLQLLSGQSVEAEFSLSSAEEAAYSLSFLVRIDLNNPDATRPNQVDIFKVVLGEDIMVSFRTSNTQHKSGVVCEVGDGATKNVTVGVPQTVLSCGSYAHIGLSVSTTDVKLLINATEVLSFKRGTNDTKQGIVTLHGPDTSDSSSGCMPIASAVISHFAILRVASDAESFVDFCKSMKKQFVRAPPLLAFGVDGPCTDKRCTVEAANSHVGYRVAKVLSKFRVSTICL